MKLSVYRISLDVHDAHSGQCLDMKQKDTARQISITLTDGGFPYQIGEECYAVFAATKADGKKLRHHCSIEKNTILYEVRPQTTAAVGLCECEIKLYGSGDKLLMSPGFSILVSEDAVTDDEELESQDEVDDLTHLISETSRVLTHVENVNARSEALIEDLEEKQELLAGKVSDAERYAKDANAAENEAKSYARLADASEDKASTYATAAYNHLQNAQTASSQAQEARESAASSEEHARMHMNIADKAKEQAKAAAEEAKQSAEQAAANVEAALSEAMESGQFDGKSAYQYAKDGGYTGTEEEFAELMANGGGGNSGQNLTLDTTLTQSGKAADAKAVGDALDELEEKIPSIEGLAKSEDIPKVPNWAMQASKPTYTASEVGALPNTYTPPNQTAEQVGADPKGTATAAVSQHNTADDSHGDIRLELEAINDRLTAFFDSDNQTLDELSEIVAYITSNKSLIDAITTSKVSVADIINNLTTNVSNKPLSAAQGVVLKSLIDTLSGNLANYQPKGDYALRSELPTVPTKVSAFTNDAGYLTKHQDISGKVDKDKLTLGRDASGLLYLYIDGLPAGAGIELPTGGIDGYITEDKQIIFNNLPDGEYTLAYIAEDGSIVPIGALEKDTNVYYTVKNTLTNCTSNNSATQAVQGGSYSATITAKSGYEMSSIKVTMGGSDISSSAVSGGNISIANVTGNIVITAVATEIVVVPTYTNLFDPSKAQINKRVSNSFELKDGAGHVTTEFIDIQGKTPFTNSTKFYVKGANFNATSSGSAQARIITYKTIPSTPYSGEYSVITANNMTQTDEGNGVISVSGVASSFIEGIKYMVLTLKVSDSTITAADIQNIVVTIDEPIV